MSRWWDRIHWTWDNDNGLRLGRGERDKVIERMKADGTQKPHHGHNERLQERDEEFQGKKLRRGWRMRIVGLRVGSEHRRVPPGDVAVESVGTAAADRQSARAVVCSANHGAARGDRRCGRGGLAGETPLQATRAGESARRRMDRACASVCASIRTTSPLQQLLRPKCWPICSRTAQMRSARRPRRRCASDYWTVSSIGATLQRDASSAARWRSWKSNMASATVTTGRGQVRCRKALANGKARKRSLRRQATWQTWVIATPDALRSPRPPAHDSDRVRVVYARPADR